MNAKFHWHYIFVWSIVSKSKFNVLASLCNECNSSNCDDINHKSHVDHTCSIQSISREYNQRTNGPVNAHLISWPSKAQNIQNQENIGKEMTLAFITHIPS